MLYLGVISFARSANEQCSWFGYRFFMRLKLKRRELLSSICCSLISSGRTPLSSPVVLAFYSPDESGKGEGKGYRTP